eukprot:scaffold113033_cov49-Prasinocladus_malaysianus.AAC.1
MLKEAIVVPRAVGRPVPQHERQARSLQLQDYPSVPSVFHDNPPGHLPQQLGLVVVVCQGDKRVRDSYRV